MVRFLVLLVAFTGIAMTTGHAQARLRVDLYLAQNTVLEPGAHGAPPKLHQQLHEVFGFEHYELLQTQQIELRHEWDHWFMPRRDFFMRVVPLPNVPGRERSVNYEIYKDGFIVASGHFEPQGGTPLFINGPDFHQGRLILVLEAREKDED